MSRRLQLKWALLFACLFSVLCGCAREEPPVIELASLPYLRHSHHPDLQAELARLESEQATPQLLDRILAGSILAEGILAEDAAANSDHPKTASEEASRLAERLSEICPAQDVQLTLQSADRLFAEGTLDLDPVTLEKSRAILQECAEQQRTYRQLFQHEDFRFAVSLNDGLMADLSFLTHARLAHRLEMLAAAEGLAAGAPSVVLPNLRNMLRIDARLAELYHVGARRTAAELRANALAVVAVMFQHPECSHLVFDEVLMMLESELTHWPPERNVWIGDRALGLHAYEMVRDGQLMSILTADEITVLEEQGDLQAFASAVQNGLDADEWFYLSTVRELLTEVDKPFCQRLPFLEQLTSEIESLSDTPRYPLFAARVLLSDIAVVQRELAADRARCEAWVLALCAAKGMTSETLPKSPVTCDAYTLTRTADAVVVGGILGPQDGPTVRVPLTSDTNRGNQRTTD